MKHIVTLTLVVGTLILVGCTTITTTGKDGAVTKTTTPVVSLWEKGFDFASMLYKDNKKTAVISAPKKGE